MVKNISQNATFLCMNNHAEPIPMIVRERTDNTHDNFYACSKYMRQDEAHPDGFTKGEHGCLNRLSFSDAGDIISKFNKIVENDLNDGVITDYENLTFEHRNIKVKVLKYKNGSLKFGILNKKAIENGKH